MLTHHARLMHHLHRLLPAVAAETDAELLDRYIRLRDEAAFAVLVRRHGAMVLGVCQRVVGDLHTAEDAFQVTFLALARQAGSIRRPAALAAWLYGTAVRVAGKARAAACRRAETDLTSSVEAVLDPRPDPFSVLSAREVLMILDEEVQRLPEAYRLAVISCCLEGKTLEDAARHLGWTMGALRGRLERGRAKLHSCLARRGLTLAVTLAMAEAARGSAEAGLLADTIRVALAFAGVGTMPAEVPAAAARLAGEVVGGVGTAKVKLMLTLLVMFGMTALGASIFTRPAPDEPAAKAKAVDEPRPMVKPKHVDRYGDPLPSEAISRIGSSRLRTGGRLMGLAYSADGKTIISATQYALGLFVEDGSIQLWDADTGKLRHTIASPISYMTSFLASADGKVVHLCNGRIYQALDTATGKELRRVKIGDDQSSGVQLSPGGAMVAVAGPGGGVRLFDLTREMERHRWKFDVGNLALAFTPDGKTLAVGMGAGLIKLVDTATGESRGKAKTPLKRVTQIDISPDGNKLVAAGLFESPVIIWDLKAGKELSRIDGEPGKQRVYSSVFSADSQHVFLASGWQYTGMYEVATGKEIRRFPNWASKCLALSHDGKKLLAGNHSTTISQWEIGTGKLLAASAEPINGVAPVRFIAGGKQLLTQREVFVAYDWKTGLETQRFAQAPTENSFWTSLSADSRLLTSPAADGRSIVVMDATTGKVAHTLAGYERFVWGTLLSLDGKKVYSSGTDKTVRIWDLANAKQLHKLTGFQGAPRMLLSADGRWLATALPTRDDPGFCIWDAATGKLFRKIAPKRGTGHSMAFSATGNEFAMGSGIWGSPESFGDVGIFDVRTGAEIKAFVGHTESVDGVALSGDGRTLATSSMDKTLRIWEVASGLERHRFIGHDRGAQAPLFSPDGSLLAAYSADAAILLWDVYGKHSPIARLPAPASIEKRDRLWQDLASPDAKLAFQAIRGLVQNPGLAVALCRDRLKPPAPVDATRLKQWLHDLDSDNFEVRQDAGAKLAHFETRIEVQLREALQQIKSLETKRRLEALVAKMDASPQRMRQSRALETLEQIATAEALRLLETLAAGNRGTWLAREAAASLDRIRQQ